MQIVDLRSDTITKPTLDMRQAMMDAPVGDDVFGEDPTVNKLEARVADLLGHQAGLFVPSGTMGNQLAINTHTQPGDEVICEAGNHIFNYEGGGPALLSGVQLHPITGERGVLTAEQVSAAIRPTDHHFPASRLIVLENTHNRAGGTIFPLKEMQAIHNLARSKQLKLHLDGARLWNAHVATGIPLKDYGKLFDSVSVCLSKGLGAPVGSVLVGSKEFVDRAHRYRKIYGGGMRQVGILAAAGLYALEHNIQRMQDDHRRAYQIAQTLAEKPGVSMDLEATKTNIVIADFGKTGRSSFDLYEKLKNKGVLTIAFSPTRIRFVTHLAISDDDISKTCEVLGQVLA